MRILLVEHDVATAQSIELMLRAEQMNVYVTDVGEEAVGLGRLYDYDAIVLGTNTALEIVRALRVAKIRTPILILSDLDSVEDKVRGLGTGADDYVTKPFCKDELIARLYSLVRRSKGHAVSTIEVGNLVVDLNSRIATAGGVKLRLTGKEYQMLELLALRKGATVSKESFLSHVYGGMDEPEIKIVDVFICKLRKKLTAANAQYIHTTWGFGYILQEPQYVPTLRHVPSPSLVPYVESPPLQAELAEVA